MNQKFKKGDHVRIAKFLGEYMLHFPSDCNATVMGSYADIYGGDDINNYQLDVEGFGRVAWYRPHQLELREFEFLIDEIRKDKDGNH